MIKFPQFLENSSGKTSHTLFVSCLCSEEGLEDVTNLLSNLSYGPESTRDTILLLLLQGARELGDVVRQNILDLQKELQQLKKTNAATSSAESGEESSDDRPGTSQPRSSGALTDRFTNEAVVLNAPSKVKSGGGSELQVIEILEC